MTKIHTRLNFLHNFPQKKLPLKRILIMKDCRKTRIKSEEGGAVGTGGTDKEIRSCFISYKSPSSSERAGREEEQGQDGVMRRRHTCKGGGVSGGVASNLMSVAAYSWLRRTRSSPCKDARRLLVFHFDFWGL